VTKFVTLKRKARTPEIEPEILDEYEGTTAAPRAANEDGGDLVLNVAFISSIFADAEGSTLVRTSDGHKAFKVQGTVAEVAEKVTGAAMDPL
jgi:hypothetical protein